MSELRSAKHENVLFSPMLACKEPWKGHIANPTSRSKARRWDQAVRKPLEKFILTTERPEWHDQRIAEANSAIEAAMLTAASIEQEDPAAGQAVLQSTLMTYINHGADLALVKVLKDKRDELRVKDARGNLTTPNQRDSLAINAWERLLCTLS